MEVRNVCPVAEGASYKSPGPTAKFAPCPGQRLPAVPARPPRCCPDKSTMTQPRFHLLQAPLDIRHLIYEAYVTRPGGLFYDYESGKLRDANGTPVEMALMRTCKQVASEMEGLAFRENTINFKTWRGDMQRGRDKAWRYGHYILDLTRKLILKNAQSSVTATNAIDSVSSRFPFLRFHLENFFASPRMSADGRRLYRSRRSDLIDSEEPMELIRLAILGTLRHASTAGDAFKDEALACIRSAVARSRESPEVILSVRKPTHVLRHLDVDRWDPLEVVHFEDRRWTVPTDEDITELWSVVKIAPYPPREMWTGEGRVSAVYSAVRFLQALTDRGRSHVRQMHLTEDRIGLHDNFAYALVPICIANPQIRITRRFLLWTTIFTKVSSHVPCSSTCGLIAQAASLSVLGMPEVAYSVVLDPEGHPEKATELFQQHLHRSIAWALALAEWEGTEAHLAINAGHVADWEPIVRIMAQILVDVSAGASSIRCEFDCGKPMNVKDILKVIRMNPPTPSNPLRYQYNQASPLQCRPRFRLEFYGPPNNWDENTYCIDYEEDRLELEAEFPPPVVDDGPFESIVESDDSSDADDSDDEVKYSCGLDSSVLI